MNIRNVLKTYSLLRQLTDDESALLETLRGLNDTERESLVVALQPEKTTTKRASKKSSKSASKSSRAQSLSGAIQRTPKAKVDNDNDYTPCQFIVDSDKGLKCGASEGDLVHDLTYLSSHPFDSGIAARSAVRRSSTNGGAISTIASTETETEREGVGAVARGSSTGET